MNYGCGEIYGIASTPERFGVRDLGARTPIRGLYLTGRMWPAWVWWCNVRRRNQRFSRIGKESLSAVSKPRVERIT